MQLPQKKTEFLHDMAQIRETWNLSEEICQATEAFVCNLYRHEVYCVDLPQYKHYCVKGGKVEP